jgi:hypothetical protein
MLIWEGRPSAQLSLYRAVGFELELPSVLPATRQSWLW